MRVRTAFAIAAVAVVLAAGTGPASADDAVTVFPPKAEPGSTVAVRASCAGGAQWVEYTSPAFSEVSRVALDGAADSEEHFALDADLEPGQYQVRAECGSADSSRMLYSGVTVVAPDGAPDGAPDASADLAGPPAGPTPSGAPDSGGGGLHRMADPAGSAALPTALAVGVLAACALVLASGRRGVRRGR